MVINKQNIDHLFIGYSTAFNKAFNDAETNYSKIAMVVPSSTRETTYAWMGQIPSMREWIGDREIQNLIAHDYTIKNKTYISLKRV